MKISNTGWLIAKFDGRAIIMFRWSTLLDIEDVRCDMFRFFGGGIAFEGESRSQSLHFQKKSDCEVFVECIRFSSNHIQ